MPLVFSSSSEDHSLTVVALIGAPTGCPLGREGYTGKQADGGVGRGPGDPPHQSIGVHP